MSKRKRDPTFTASEKENLLALVAANFSILECKKTDAVSTKLKNDLWQRLADEFNDTSGVYHRDWTVLKNCWENIKKRVRHTFALNKQQCVKSETEQPEQVMEDPILNRALKLLQGKVFEFVPCFDSDGTQILASDNNRVLDTQGTSSDMINDSSDWPRNPALSKSPSPDSDEPTLRIDTKDWHTFNIPPRAQTPPAAAPPVATPDATKSEALRSSQKSKPTLLKAHALEEHKTKMNILRLQEQKEREILKQEILKTRQEEVKLRILQLRLKTVRD